MRINHEELGKLLDTIEPTRAAEAVDDNTVEVQPVISEPDPVKPQRYSENFPGVKLPDGPLTNEQLKALRLAAAAAGGRPLTPEEYNRVLGLPEEPAAAKNTDRYFEI